MINDPILTDEEQKFLKYQYIEPNSTLTEFAHQMGYSHPEKVKRLKTKIAKKLQHYNPYPHNIERPTMMAHTKPKAKATPQPGVKLNKALQSVPWLGWQAKMNPGFCQGLVNGYHSKV